MVEGNVDAAVAPIGVDNVASDMGETTMNQSGFLETIKEKFSPHGLVEKIKDNKDLLILMGMYLIGGFLAGFILKKCNKFIFFIALFVGFILFLNYQGYISIAIHWDAIQKFIGIEPISLPDGKMMPVYWQWIKDHIALVISFSIGFAGGLRLG